MEVSINYSNGNVVTLPLADIAPSLFAGRVVWRQARCDSHVVTSANPARVGQALQLFARLALDQSVISRKVEVLLLGIPSSTMIAPVVTIGGQNAPRSVQRLAPGFAGLYQLNVTVPSTLSRGSAAGECIDGRTNIQDARRTGSINSTFCVISRLRRESALLRGLIFLPVCAYYHSRPGFETNSHRGHIAWHLSPLYLPRSAVSSRWITYYRRCPGTTSLLSPDHRGSTPFRSRWRNLSRQQEQ